MFNGPLKFPFRDGMPLVMVCHFTGIYDVNRRTTLPNDDIVLVKDWLQSLQAHQVNGIIFHNNFSDTVCEEYQNSQLSFIRVTNNEQFSPNVYRYLIYRAFLSQHASKITSLFLTDVSDVVMLKNPFSDPYFIANNDQLFCGNEDLKLDNEWMFNHSLNLRSRIANFVNYEEEFKDETLLNCGIIGGNIAIINTFVSQLAAIHEQFNRNNTSLYTGDMGAFNYLARTVFNNRLIHGCPVNTIFKKYEYSRTDCWFRHK